MYKYPSFHFIQKQGIKKIEESKDKSIPFPHFTQLSILLFSSNPKIVLMKNIDGVIGYTKWKYKGLIDKKIWYMYQNDNLAIIQGSKKVLSLKTFIKFVN